MNLTDYVLAHTDRGECRCGKCIPDPEGHTADVYFFPVAIRNAPSLDEFKALTAAHRGEFTECDPFDGKEHSYIELGGWIGDQGLAMQYMGLGALLGAFTLLTPKLLPIPKELQDQMAGAGMVSIQAKRIDATPKPDAVDPAVAAQG